ncbi:MAG: hypothetical protein ABIG08_02005 [bacterium]
MIFEFRTLIFTAFVIFIIAVFTLGDFFNFDVFNSLNLGSLFDVSLISQKEKPSTEKEATETKETSQSKYYPSQIKTPSPTAPNGKKESSVEKTEKPSISINTFIIYGPLKNEVIEETNKVVFEFEAEVTPGNTEGQIIFETKIEGLEQEWKENYSSERTIEFPPGPKEYTFLVRAKIKNKDIIDLTPAKRTFRINISPHFGKVQFSKVQTPGIPAQPSLITLSAYLKEGENVNITDWEIKGKYGSFLIPKGIETHNPLIESRQSQNIVVKKGDAIYISSEENPLGNKDWSFRPNSCMGYLNNSHNFTIPISNSCPKIEEPPRYLDKCCKEYIATLDNCQQPKYQKLVEYDLLKDSQCMNYLNSRFNYYGCFVNFYQEKNFLQNQWHIYLDRESREIMDNNLDTIYLRDKQGLLVDKYEYGCVYCGERSK